MKYSIDVPVNSCVTDMIHEIKMNRMVITVDNFNDPIFDIFN